MWHLVNWECGLNPGLIKQSIQAVNQLTMTVGDKGIEMTLEIRLNESSTKFVNELQAITGPCHTTLVSYNGAYDVY